MFHDDVTGPADEWHPIGKDLRVIAARVQNFGNRLVLVQATAANEKPTTRKGSVRIQPSLGFGSDVSIRSMFSGVSPTSAYLWGLSKDQLQLSVSIGEEDIDDV